MIYRKFQDLQLSALGMGAMRLPVVDGNDAVIDEPAAVVGIAVFPHPRVPFRFSRSIHARSFSIPFAAEKQPFAPA